jgi:transcriptional regulator with XRE-family HTH domain
VNGIDRAQLADFLRRCRERMDPAALGLPPRTRTRTPGLRREDVAQLAGISVDYYARLEQGRGAFPSEQVVGALARALRLSEDECDYLHRVAGYPTRSRRPSRHVAPGLLLVLDRLVDAPAQVVSDSGQVLARNALAEALHGGPALPGRAGNLFWAMFADPAHEPRIPEADRPALAAHHVANLRATHARRPADPEVNALIKDLLAVSGEFRELWRRHDVAVMRDSGKTFLHPQVGPLELDCVVLLVASGEQSLILYTARPGTDAAERLALLRVLGHERFDGSDADGGVRG